MTRHDTALRLHQLERGITIRRDDQVDAVLKILVDDLDSPGSPVKYSVESVGAPFFGDQPYARSCLHLFTGYGYRFWWWVIFTWKSWKIPASTTYHAFSPSLCW